MAGKKIQSKYTVLKTIIKKENTIKNKLYKIIRELIKDKDKTESLHFYKFFGLMGNYFRGTVKQT